MTTRTKAQLVAENYALRLQISEVSALATAREERLQNAVVAYKALQLRLRDTEYKLMGQIKRGNLLKARNLSLAS